MQQQSSFTTSTEEPQERQKNQTPLRPVSQTLP